MKRKGEGEMGGRGVHAKTTNGKRNPSQWKSNQERPTQGKEISRHLTFFYILKYTSYEIKIRNLSLGKPNEKSIRRVRINSHYFLISLE